MADGATDKRDDGMIRCFKPLMMHFRSMEEGKNLNSQEDGSLGEGGTGSLARWYAKPKMWVAIESNYHKGKFWQITDDGDVNCDGDGVDGHSRFEVVVRNADEGHYALHCRGIATDDGTDSGNLAVKDDEGNLFCGGRAEPGWWKMYALPKGNPDDKVQLTGEDPFLGVPRDASLVFESVRNGKSLRCNAGGECHAAGGTGPYALHTIHAFKRVRFVSRSFPHYIRIAEGDDAFVVDAKDDGTTDDCLFEIETCRDGGIRLKSLPHGDKGPEPDRMHLGWREKERRVQEPEASAGGHHTAIELSYVEKDD